MKFSILFFVFEAFIFAIWGYKFHQNYRDSSNLKMQLEYDIKEHTAMNKNFITIDKIDEKEYLSSITGELKLVYDTILNIPQDYVAYCELTHQVTSVLSIQNLSKNFIATVFISPLGGVGKSRIYTIPSNTTTPIRILHNWNGAVLKVANISAKSAILKVSLF